GCLSDWSSDVCSSDLTNDFGGVLTLTGGATQITDANTLTLGTLATGALTANSTGALNLGQGTVTGNLVANSGGNAITQTAALTVDRKSVVEGRGGQLG